jgi:hypothetical protein
MSLVPATTGRGGFLSLLTFESGTFDFPYCMEHPATGDSAMVDHEYAGRQEVCLRTRAAGYWPVVLAQRDHRKSGMGKSARIAFAVSFACGIEIIG